MSTGLNNLSVVSDRRLDQDPEDGAADDGALVATRGQKAAARRQEGTGSPTRRTG